MTKQDEFQDEGRAGYDSHWHLDKKVPIAIILTLMAQTTGIVWWASNLSARVENIERYVLSNAPHSDRLTRVETKVESIERGISRIENVLQSRTPAGFAAPNPK